MSQSWRSPRRFAPRDDTRCFGSPGDIGRFALRGDTSRLAPRTDTGRFAPRGDKGVSPPGAKRRVRWPASRARLAAFALTGLLAVPALAQRDWSQVEVKAQQVAPGIYMLQGAGGNIGVSVGPDGVFLVDDQYAPLTDKIKAAVVLIDPRPIRFVLNTHWHPDHTGGNENLGKAGTLIVAHDNVRTRLAAGLVNELMNRTIEPAPAGALPVVTFDNTITFHLNGEEIHAWHVPPAHTDGDAVVHFRKADVVHTGDLLFVGGYPVLDVPSGGTITGWIAVLDGLLARVGPTTKVIPGHGPLATREDLQRFRDMLATARERVLPLVQGGKSVDEVIAAKPLADLEEAWGKGFMPTDSFLRAVHMSLARESAAAAVREDADGRSGGGG